MLVAVIFLAVTSGIYFYADYMVKQIEKEENENNKD